MGGLYGSVPSCHTEHLSLRAKCGLSQPLGDERKPHQALTHGRSDSQPADSVLCLYTASSRAPRETTGPSTVRLDRSQKRDTGSALCLLAFLCHILARQLVCEALGKVGT